jgi:hypothetical protein
VAEEINDPKGRKDAEDKNDRAGQLVKSTAEGRLGGLM